MYEKSGQREEMYMRIGLFTDTYLPDVNGVAVSVHTLAKGLRALGHEVWIITTKPSLSSVKIEDHILRLQGIQLRSLYGYSMTSPLHIKAYYMIEELQLDLLHVHTEFGTGLFSIFCAKHLKLPLVYTYHTSYEDYLHYLSFLNQGIFQKVTKKVVIKLTRKFANASQLIISPSEKTKKVLEGYQVKPPIYVQPTGLDLARFYLSPEEKAEAKRSIRQHYGVHEKDPLLITVGRLGEEKRFDVLIRCMQALKASGSSAKLLLVGAGPKEKDLQNLSQSLGVDDVVLFTGKVEPQSMPQYYHASDVFISASLSETQGLTFIEALASGLPLIACYDDVLAHLIEEKKTGYFFEDEASFVHCVSTYLALEEEEKASFVSCAREKVKPYEMQTFAEEVAKLYEQVHEEHKKEERAKSEDIQ